MKKRRAIEGDDDLQVLPAKKHRRRILLGHDLNMKVQLYLKRVREGGGVVSARICCQGHSPNLQQVYVG